MNKLTGVIARAMRAAMRAHLIFAFYRTSLEQLSDPLLQAACRCWEELSEACWDRTLLADRTEPTAGGIIKRDTRDAGSRKQDEFNTILRDFCRLRSYYRYIPSLPFFQGLTTVVPLSIREVSHLLTPQLTPLAG